MFIIWTLNKNMPACDLNLLWLLDLFAPKFFFFQIDLSSVPVCTGYLFANDPPLDMMSPSLCLSPIRTQLRLQLWWYYQDRILLHKPSQSSVCTWYLFANDIMSLSLCLRLRSGSGSDSGTGPANLPISDNQPNTNLAIHRHCTVDKSGKHFTEHCTIGH